MAYHGLIFIYLSLVNKYHIVTATKSPDHMIVIKVETKVNILKSQLNIMVRNAMYPNFSFPGSLLNNTQRAIAKTTVRAGNHHGRFNTIVWVSWDGRVVFRLFDCSPVRL